MVEYIARIPLRLDLLQARIVLLVVQGVPRHARRIEFWIGEIGIWMIDEGAVIRVARNRHTTCVGKQRQIETTYPCHVLLFVDRIQPTNVAGDIENRLAL